MNNPLHIVVDAGLRGVFVAVSPQEREAETQAIQSQVYAEWLRQYNEDIRSWSKLPFFKRVFKKRPNYESYFGFALTGPLMETG